MPIARATNAVPVTKRMKRRPAPGKPLAKLENRRRISPWARLEDSGCERKPQKGGVFTHLSGLEFDDAAFNPDHGGVCAIIGTQLGEDVLDAPFDGLFAERELSSDLLVGIPIGNQPQDRKLARS